MTPTREDVLALLIERGPMTTPDLACILRRNRTVITRACRGMEEDGIVRLVGIEPLTRAYIWEAVA